MYLDVPTADNPTKRQRYDKDTETADWSIIHNELHGATVQRIPNISKCKNVRCYTIMNLNWNRTTTAFNLIRIKCSYINVDTKEKYCLEILDLSIPDSRYDIKFRNGLNHLYKSRYYTVIKEKSPNFLYATIDSIQFDYSLMVQGSRDERKADKKSKLQPRLAKMKKIKSDKWCKRKINDKIAVYAVKNATKPIVDTMLSNSVDYPPNQKYFWLFFIIWISTKLPLVLYPWPVIIYGHVEGLFLYYSAWNVHLHILSVVKMYFNKLLVIMQNWSMVIFNVLSVIGEYRTKLKLAILSMIREYWKKLKCATFTVFGLEIDVLFAILCIVWYPMLWWTKNNIIYPCYDLYLNSYG